MDKRHITLAEYYEHNFDVPLKGRDDHLMTSQALHISQPAFVPVNMSELAQIEDLIVSRGAVRGKDYIISCHLDSHSIAILTIHTTNCFISKDDYSTDKDGNVFVTE